MKKKKMTKEAAHRIKKAAIKKDGTVKKDSFAERADKAAKSNAQKGN